MSGKGGGRPGACLTFWGLGRLGDSVPVSSVVLPAVLAGPALAPTPDRLPSGGSAAPVSVAPGLKSLPRHPWGDAVLGLDPGERSPYAALHALCRVHCPASKAVRAFAQLVLVCVETVAGTNGILKAQPSRFPFLLADRKFWAASG